MCPKTKKIGNISVQSANKKGNKETVQIKERKSSRTTDLVYCSSDPPLTNLLHLSIGILLDLTFFLMFCSMTLLAQKEILCF